jgi:hypothetical protein
LLASLVLLQFGVTKEVPMKLYYIVSTPEQVLVTLLILLAWIEVGSLAVVGGVVPKFYVSSVSITQAPRCKGPYAIDISITFPKTLLLQLIYVTLP